MPKLTHEAYMGLLRKPSTYERTDEDWLQVISQIIRDFEADEATADDAMHAIAEEIITWLPGYLRRLQCAPER